MIMNPEQLRGLSLIFLIIASYLGNYFRLSLFFGFDFLFGSIFGLIVIYFYGKWWGVIAAIIGGSYTYILWGHPYAWVILIVEAVFVGHFLRRRDRSLVLLTSFYWLFIGMGLVLFSYGVILKVSLVQTGFVMVKQAINGIFNATIANFIISAIPSYSYLRKSGYKIRFSFQETLFNILVGLFLFPTLFITIVHGNQSLDAVRAEIQQELQRETEVTVSNVKTWYREHQDQLKVLASQAREFKNNTPGLQTNINIFKSAYPSFLKLYVTDAQGNIVAASPQENDQGQSLLGVNLADKLNLKKIAETKSIQVTEVHQDIVDNFPHIGFKVPVLKDGGFEGLAYGSINLDKLKNIFKFDGSDGKNIQAIIVDGKNRVILDSADSYKIFTEFNAYEEGEIILIGDNSFHWLPKKTTNTTPLIARWKKSFYVKEIAVGNELPWKLIVKISPASYIEYLQVIYLKNLSLMLLIVIIGVWISRYMSYNLSSPLIKLSQVTSDLPKKLLEHSQEENFPPSQVSEIHTLTQNFQEMTILLKEQFLKINQANETLEQRVAQRTQELMEVNINLEEEVNQRKKIEGYLRESEERYHLAVSGTNDGIWDWDIRTDETYFSPIWMKILGYENYNLPNLLSTWSARIHPEDLDRTFEAIKNHFRGETEIYECTHRLKNAQGHYIWIEAKGKCLRDDQGNPYRMVGTITDISIKKEAEETLIAAKKAAEAANKLKTEFLANMSHEIRTPMNAILGFCQLLQHKPLDDASVSYLQSITSSGQILMGLINDILDLSTIEADKLNIYYENVNLEMLLSDVTHIFAEAAKEKKLELKLVIEPNAPKYIFFDGLRLRQIMVNIVGNAIKFTEKGFIKIYAQTKETNCLELSVEDTGIGIAPQEHEKIFEAFTQSDGQSTRKYGGTGLGLTITRRLTNILGGSIFLESELNQGSKFTLMFPDVIFNTEQAYHNLDISQEKEINNVITTSEQVLENPDRIKIHDLPGLQKKLQELQETQWKKLHQKMIRRDLKDFARTLEKLSEEHTCSTLKSYVDTIFQNIEAFDIEGLINIIKDFPNLCNSLS